MFISIIIPIKNEPAIQELIDEINDSIKQKHEIIVVDKSIVIPEVVGARVIIQESDGLGNAFLEGLSHARGDIVVLMDGDGSHRPQDLLNMLNNIGEYDIVLGSKLVRGGKSCDALGRKIVTIAFAWITRLILGKDIKDPMTGMMATKRDVLSNMKLKPRGFKIAIEVVYKSKAKTVEVPISFCRRKAGYTKAGFNMNGVREICRIFMLLLELKWGRMRGYW
ncbi:MAG: glycosyltransferase [Methanothrix sp.]|nr:glycosyltransferase [Methanothrix sp.]